MGIVQEWHCSCPAYVKMPHVTDLGSQEFNEQLVMDGVVMIISSCENVVMKS